MEGKAACHVCVLFLFKDFVVFDVLHPILAWPLFEGLDIFGDLFPRQLTYWTLTDWLIMAVKYKITTTGWTDGKN